MNRLHPSKAPDAAGYEAAVAVLRADLERQAPPPLPYAALAALRRRGAEAPPAASPKPPAAPIAAWLERLAAWPRTMAVAAVILLSVLLMWQPRRADNDPAAAPPGNEAFVPVVAAERWAALAAAPESQAWLISAELSQQRLGQLGLPYDPEHAGEMRRAQLLVAPSGEVLAVRLLQ
jgi:hypothetical protein